MKVKCPGCTAEFVVEDGRIPPLGTQVRCPKCFKAFQVSGQSNDPASQLEAELGMGPAQTGSTRTVGTAGGFGAGLGSFDASKAGLAEKPTEIVSGQNGPKTVAPSMPFGDGAMTPPQPGVPNRTEVVVPPMNIKGRDRDGSKGGYEFELSDNLGLFGSSGQKPQGRPSPMEEPSGAVFSADELFMATESGDRSGGQDLASEFDVADGGGVDLDLSIAPPTMHAEQPFPPVPPLPPSGTHGGFGGSFGGSATTYGGAGVGAHDDVLGVKPTMGQDAAGFGGGLGEPDAGMPPPIPGGGSGSATKGVAGPSLDDIDFSMLLDENPEPPPVEFQGGGAPGMQFEKPEMPDAFRMEEISFDDLGDFGGPKPAAGAPAEAGGFSYDLDIDASTAPKPQPTVKAGEAVGTKATAKAGSRKAKKKSSAAGGLAAVLIVILAGGAGAYYLGLLDPILGTEKPSDAPESKRAKKKAEAAEQSLSFDSRLMTSAQGYINRLELIQKEMKVNPDTTEQLEAEMMWNLAWFRLLFPGEFNNYTHEGEELGKKIEDLRKKYIDKKNEVVDAVFVDKMEAMEAGVAGDWAKASAEYKEYVSGKTLRAGQLLETRQMTKALAREDNLFHALLALRTNDLEEAESLLVLLREERKEDIHSNFLLAQLEAAKARGYTAEEKDKAGAAREKAAGYLGEVLEGAPDFTDARLLLAELMLERGEVNRSVDLARECLDQARKKNDPLAQVRGYRAVVYYLEKQNDDKALFALLEDFFTSLPDMGDSPVPEDLLLKLAGIYFKQKDLVKAQDVMKRCDKVCGTPEYYLLATRIFRAAGREEAANFLAVEGVKKYPDDHALLVAMAEVALHTKHMDSARSYLEQALRKKPEDEESAITLAKIYVDQQAWGEARRVVQASLRAKRDSLPLLELLTEILTALGEDKEVASSLKRMLELKDDILVRQKLVRIMARQGDHKEALKHFEVLEERGAMTKELRPSFALALRSADRIPEAVEVLKAVFKDNPADGEAARFLADIYLQKKDFFNAKFYLEACRRIDSTDHAIQHSLGTTCLAIQDEACAMEAFRAAAEMLPTNLTYLQSYAKLLYTTARKDETDNRRKTIEQARKYFDYIISRYESDVTIPKEAQDPEIYFSRSTILFESGRFDGALRDLEQAMERAPHRTDILSNYADTLFQMGRYEDAEKYYMEMITRKVSVVYSYMQLGRISLNRGDREKAREFLTRCTTEGPGQFPEAYRFLGDIYLEKGLRKLASVNYDLFLKHALPNDPALDEVRTALRRLK